MSPANMKSKEKLGTLVICMEREVDVKQSTWFAGAVSKAKALTNSTLLVLPDGLNSLPSGYFPLGDSLGSLEVIRVLEMPVGLAGMPMWYLQRRGAKSLLGFPIRLLYLAYGAFFRATMGLSVSEYARMLSLSRHFKYISTNRRFESVVISPKLRKTLSRLRIVLELPDADVVSARPFAKTSKLPCIEYLTKAASPSVNGILHYPLLGDFFENRRYEYVACMRFPPRPSDVVLDAGCGSKHPFSFWLARNCERVVGVDLTPPLPLKPPTIPNLEYKQASFVELPFADQSFDKIYCISVLEHLKDELMLAATMAEFARILKPEGIFVCTIDLTFDFDGHHSRFYDLQNGLSEHMTAERYLAPIAQYFVLPTTIPQPRLFAELARNTALLFLALPRS